VTPGLRGRRRETGRDDGPHLTTKTFHCDSVPEFALSATFGTLQTSTHRRARCVYHPNYIKKDTPSISSLRLQNPYLQPSPHQPPPPSPSKQQTAPPNVSSRLSLVTPTAYRSSVDKWWTSTVPAQPAQPSPTQPARPRLRGHGMLRGCCQVYERDVLTEARAEYSGWAGGPSCWYHILVAR
jgi:hypothetical protein